MSETVDVNRREVLQASIGGVALGALATGLWGTPTAGAAEEAEGQAGITRGIRVHMVDAVLTTPRAAAGRGLELVVDSYDVSNPVIFTIPMGVGGKLVAVWWAPVTNLGDLGAFTRIQPVPGNGNVLLRASATPGREGRIELVIYGLYGI